MLRVLLMFIALAVLPGCVAGKPETAALPAVAPQDGGNEDEAAAAVSDMLRLITGRALGTPYVRGGTSLNGFDCSGFVQWTYRKLGVELPRTAREQSEAGWEVSLDDLRIGDIVTFRHPRRGWHCGIYMGDGKFVHSPSRRKLVRYSSLSAPYFRDRFVVARRVLKAGEHPDFEAVAGRLALAESEKRLAPDRPGRKAAAKGAGKARSAAAKGKKPDKAAKNRASGVVGAKKNSPGKEDRRARI